MCVYQLNESPRSQRNFKKQIAEPVELALNKPEHDMWDKVLEVFRGNLAKAEASYLKKAKSLSFPT